MPRRPLTPAQIQKREQNAFSRKIQSAFKNAGFEYLSTSDIERQFGSKTGELDGVFLYENVLVICEETISASGHIKAHAVNKSVLCKEIAENRTELLDWLKADFSEKFAHFDTYTEPRYKIFFVYITKNKFNPSDADRELLKPMVVLENSDLNYFHKLSQNIKLSAKNEFFRFLGLTRSDIGTITSGDSQDKIKTTIICPPETTGHTNGVRIVSFMMSAENLINNSYVLRKDNWENSIALYQRLIEKGRIQSIRKHLATKQTAFYNNIIVSLPPGITFMNSAGEIVNLADIQDFSERHVMQIPNELNSICVIDGQHRIFAHYEGIDNLESTISPLRKKFHLLVTGLIFPDDWTDYQRIKYEGEIFLDINSNARPVPPDVLLFIETLKDPFSDLGIARQVLERLNQRTVFKNLFQMSLMEESTIKIASIIKFALRNLVDASDETKEDTLYHYWRQESDSQTLTGSQDLDLLGRYVDFCVNALDIYFSALKSVRSSDWNNPDSKILSTTSINGFIMALRRSLKFDGIADNAHYRVQIEKLNIDFAKAAFPYASSQYNKFSKQILSECFAIEEDADGNWSKSTT